MCGSFPQEVQIQITATSSVSTLVPSGDASWTERANLSHLGKLLLNNSSVFYICLSKTTWRFLWSMTVCKKGQQFPFPSHWEWEERPVNLSTISHGFGSTADTLPWASSPVLLNFLYIVLKKLLRNERFSLLYIFLLVWMPVIPTGQRR